MIKSGFVAVFSAVILICISFKQKTNPLAGKWECLSASSRGPLNVTAIFRVNGTFDGFINQKQFVSGTYRLTHDTLYISDPTCNTNYEGVYTVKFFGQHDSLVFHALQDTCSGRRMSTDGKIFKHITEKAG